MLKSRNNFFENRKWKWRSLEKWEPMMFRFSFYTQETPKKKRIWLISFWTSEKKGLAVCSSTQNLQRSLDFHNFSIIRETRQFSKQFPVTAIETQESCRHRIWSVPHFFFLSKFLSHTEAFSRWENHENLIENVLLVSFSLKIFSAIKMSISLWQASKVESSKKWFVKKKFFLKKLI